MTLFCTNITAKKFNHLKYNMIMRYKLTYDVWNKCKNNNTYNMERFERFLKRFSGR